MVAIGKQIYMVAAAAALKLQTATMNYRTFTVSGANNIAAVCTAVDPTTKAATMSAADGSTQTAFLQNVYMQPSQRASIIGGRVL